MQVLAGENQGEERQVEDSGGRELRAYVMTLDAGTAFFVNLHDPWILLLNIVPYMMWHSL